VGQNNLIETFRYRKYRKLNVSIRVLVLFLRIERMLIQGGKFLLVVLEDSGLAADDVHVNSISTPMRRGLATLFY